MPKNHNLDSFLSLLHTTITTITYIIQELKHYAILYISKIQYISTCLRIEMILNKRKILKIGVIK